MSCAAVDAAAAAVIVLAVAVGTSLDTVLTPPPKIGADASRVGVVGAAVSYGESTAEGFFIDTIASPFDVFTVFRLLSMPNKKAPRGCLVPVTSSGHTLSLCAIAFIYM